MDPLNRIISAEEQLRDKKKAARNEDKNEGDYSPATQGSSKRSVAGKPAPEDSSPSESEGSMQNVAEFIKLKETLKQKNEKIKKLQAAGRKIKGERDELREKISQLKVLL